MTVGKDHDWEKAPRVQARECIALVPDVHVMWRCA
jgi:hypothetical protein